MICADCETTFDDSVELYPRLVVSKNEAIARKLAEKAQGTGELLCLKCWMESLKLVDIESLGVVIMGLMKKIKLMETELTSRRNDDVIEKIKQGIPNKWVPPQPYKVTWVSPNTDENHTFGDPNTVYCTSSAIRAVLQQSSLSQNALPQTYVGGELGRMLSCKVEY